MTKKMNLEAMSVDQMWELHEEISRVLSARLTTEKRELERRLERLRRDRPAAKVGSEMNGTAATPERRKYPRVYPKYQNPQDPSETWSGRGKTPRWLVAALETGHKLDEFAISNAAVRLVREKKDSKQGAH